jgi:hypothetical protein
MHGVTQHTNRAKSQTTEIYSLYVRHTTQDSVTTIRKYFYRKILIPSNHRYPPVYIFRLNVVSLWHATSVVSSPPKLQAGRSYLIGCTQLFIDGVNTCPPTWKKRARFYAREVCMAWIRAILGREVVNWVRLPQSRDWWWSLTDMILKLLVL